MAHSPENSLLFNRRLTSKVRSFIRSGFCIVLLIVATAGISYGWSGTGHMAVAYLAYKQLTPQTRNRANQLLKLNPFYNSWKATLNQYHVSAADFDMCIFMLAATWPDQIKSSKKYKLDGDEPPPVPESGQNIGYADKLKHKYWHYKDLPFSPDHTATQPAPAINAVERIELFADAISKASISDDIKSYDLSWLLHLVGDVHQPLHATSRFVHILPDGDRGGNSVIVCFKGKCDLPLHSYWDQIFGTTDRPSTAINAANQTLPPNAAMAQKLDPDDWVQESFTLAKSLVYRNPPIKNGKGAYTLTNKYIGDSVTAANQRIALAGARLARLLNENLK